MRTAPALRLWTCLADSSDRTPRNQFVLVVTPHVHSSPPGQRSSNCFNQSISLDVLLSPLLQDIRLAPADRIEDLSQMLLVEVIGTSQLVGVRLSWYQIGCGPSTSCVGYKNLLQGPFLIYTFLQKWPRKATDQAVMSTYHASFESTHFSEDDRMECPQLDLESDRFRHIQMRQRFGTCATPPPGLRRMA